MTLRLLLLLAFLTPCVASAKRPFIRPPYLKAGDTVAIVAPAGKIRPDADTARARERFESWGLSVKFAPHCFDRDSPYFAGTDANRAADLQQAIDNPNIKAIIAYKGGYGAVRLLPSVDLRKLRRHPKWLVGFSDITMLHLALGKLGVESIHGPMPSILKFEGDTVDASMDSLRLALFGQIDRISTAPHPLNQPGTARGITAGGNLTLICSAIGTPEQLDARRGTILLIEDVGEAVYRIDRMMQQLARSGLLKQVRAILVGHFTDMKDVKEFGDTQEVIARYTRPLGIPVVFGFPSGHQQPNHPLYLGREAEVRVTETGAEVVFR